MRLLRLLSVKFKMYNQKLSTTLEENYNLGFLPQRNRSDYFYFDSSCRSCLKNLKLSSENRRILNKTSNFTFDLIPLSEFKYTPQIQKKISSWVKELKWDFPVSSIKTIFTNHLFNYLYIWIDENQDVVAYSICYISANISHIAYVFYNPLLARSSLPIRLSLQLILDSFDKKLKYCYLGRFDPVNKIGYYKRNMPNFEYFINNNWQNFKP